MGEPTVRNRQGVATDKSGAKVPAPLVIERVTTAVDVVTRLPLPSTTSATGWVEKATPLVAPVG